MDDALRKERLHYFFDRVVDPLGYKFTPTRSSWMTCSTRSSSSSSIWGRPICPCQMRTGKREDDMRIVCPCIPFHRKHFDAMKRCWCGLFVHKDVTDPSTLPQFPPDEE